MALPQIVSRDEWLAARLRLLDQEKAHTRARDALNTERRRLPMVKVAKDYQFEGPDGTVGLAGLFEAGLATGTSQLIIQHVMFGPDWDAPCPSCSASLSEATPQLREHLLQRDTNFVLVSRAPYGKLAKGQAERGIPFPWYSSFGSDFNVDFGVSFDPDIVAPAYNYRPQPEAGPGDEGPGYSCFLRDGGDVFHTYSTFARGTEYAGNAYTLLDMTALGRQEEWEEPRGRAIKARAADPSFRE
ncbi:MAG TPA: DUF899 domain-containing protein [Streptosporangiaceae bacterium]|nr:DUF899 domain-containing protein [Streptosporangiaceae bacterium]